MVYRSVIILIVNKKNCGESLSNCGELLCDKSILWGIISNSLKSTPVTQILCVVIVIIFMTRLDKSWIHIKAKKLHLTYRKVEQARK